MMYFLLAAAVHTAAVPPTPKTVDICAALTQQIDSAQQTTSNFQAEALGDEDPARATRRATRSSALMLEVANNLSLMTSHHCAPYTHPIDMKAYESSAMQCSAAIRQDGQDQTSGLSTNAKVACDRANWRRLGE